jgi:hypothetical protein
MRVPREWYHLEAVLAAQLPQLRPAQRRGLAWWVYGAILAQSACQSAVVSALSVLGSWHSWRQSLREWLYAGAERAAPCQTQLDVSACFAPLLGWVLRLWQGDTLALAVDATYQRDRWVVLVVSVLYRGSAIPVAWQVLPANQKGAWLPSLCQLLTTLAPAVPSRYAVLVLSDRGLWSPRLWRCLRRLGWHPLMRVRAETTFAPAGQTRNAARSFVPGPGHAWVGEGVAFKHAGVRRPGTLLVVWDEDQAEPWLVLTDLAPEAVGVAWYGLRTWVELGFRALKRLGWQWQRTRRSDPERIARHWLVLAVATLWVLAYGTRVEDAEHRGLPPARLHHPPPRRPPGRRRQSVFQRGLSWLRWQLLRGRCWRRLWLTPEMWPDPSAGMVVSYHASA